jgi:hypothetical protein
VAPHQTYKDKGWISWGDWLGTGTVATYFLEYRPFKKARTFAHRLRLKNAIEWGKYCRGELKGKGKKLEDIPAKPQRTYKDRGWVNWGDWLGTGTIANRLKKYRPFKEARAFVHGLGLKSWSEWKKYCRGELREKGKKPEDIPSNPNLPYKDKGWINWYDWLGK